MIDDLRPYPDMRPSGIDWLALLPTGWEVHRAKYSFAEIDDRSELGDEELLSVSHKTGVTPRSQKNITMFMAESYEGHKVCRPGDIVVNTMWAWMAAIGVSRHVGIVSPSYGVYRARTQDRFEPRFLDYLLRTEVYRAEYVRRSRGITTSRLRLYPPDFLNTPFVQPPLDEQRLIVRFLDWHGSQTAKLIRVRKKLIALLSEQKQAIIHRAVTRGLDPDVKLKPSGIPWLGDVPEGWDVKRLKYVFSKIVGGSTPTSGEPLYWNGDVVWVTPSDISRTTQLTTSLRKITEAGLRESAATLVPTGTIIVTTRAPVGNVAIARVDLATNQGCKALLPDRKVIDSGFALLVLGMLKSELQSRATGTTFAEISASKLGDIRFPVPPLSDQPKINAMVDAATAELEASITATLREITLIQELRTRLISDVVTGKLDVRKIAANLPETGADDAAPDDAEVPPEDPDEALPEDEEAAA